MIPRRTCLKLAVTVNGFISVNGQIPKRELLPIYSFEIPFSPNQKLRQLRSRENSLFALATTRGVGTYVIEVDATGNVKSKSSLPVDTQRFTIMPNGQFVGLRTVNRTSYISRDFHSEMVYPGPLDSICMVGPNIWGVYNGTIVPNLGGPTTQPIVLAGSGTTLPVELPGGRLALLSRREQLMWIADPTVRVSAPIRLMAPEFPTGPMIEDGFALYSPCGHHSGDIFCAMFPYIGPEGARVLRFDQKGNLKDRLLLKMPEFPETHGVADGRLTANEIVVMDDVLYAGSSTTTTTRLSAFQLPY